MSKNPPRLCIIDDDAAYKFIFTREIKKIDLPIDTLTFSDGEEGINFLVDNINNSENLPSVIFLDINMPIMNGWEFLEEYGKLKISKEITIYMVSSSIDPVDIKKAKEINDISDYLVKPILYETLLKIINSHF